jgi:hypothetical protein
MGQVAEDFLNIQDVGRRRSISAVNLGTHLMASVVAFCLDSDSVAFAMRSCEIFHLLLVQRLFSLRHKSPGN